MKKIQVLLLQTEAYTPAKPLPSYIQLECSSFFTKTEKRGYDLVILNRTPFPEEQEPLYWATKAHALFVTEQADLEQCRDYCESKLARKLQACRIDEFLCNYAKWFFHESYGEKYVPTNLAVSRNFKGEVCWNGSYSLKLTGDFGQSLNQVVFWRNNIPIEEEQVIDFWLEYTKTPGVEISLKAVLFASGSMCDVVATHEFSEEQLKKVVRIKAPKRVFVFVSICAKGSGALEIIALHDRYSRGPYGHFLPGGERYVTSQREELFCYFDPGDRKPPLNVYFSGYKTREGFEGYNMMRAMGAPFLLISESRLEGGSFYIGTAEYESMLVSVLRKYMDKLGFEENQIILSGISMGSTGALYYGCDIRPHAVIVGKPLVNLGTIALNEKLTRPGGFPTSLDMLRVHGGGADRQAAQTLDSRFWQKFEATDWENTKLILSYMIEDDYDSEAYEEMVDALSTKDGQIYGRGLHGRHNDNTYGIVQWFVSQYRKILREDFPDSNTVYRREVNE